MNLTPEQRESILDSIGNDLDECEYYQDTGAFSSDYRGEEQSAATVKAIAKEDLADALEAFQAHAGLIDQARRIAAEWRRIAEEFDLEPGISKLEADRMVGETEPRTEV